MTTAGLDPRLIAIEPKLSREEQGRRAVRALIASSRSYDGLFAVCDELALGALRELTQAGIAVPGQAALIGFDGTRAAAQAMPPLSTI